MPERRGPRENFRAMGASVGPFPGVESLVFLEQVLPGERFTARGTDVT